MSGRSSEEEIQDELNELAAIDLRDPRLAAFLAWLVPGAGHIYQRRTGKGLLFMTCILGTFFFGLYLGGGKVVYASMRPQDRRLPYLCQVGVGLAALPAIVQANRMRDPYYPKAPYLNGFMAPPRLPGQVIPRGSVDPEYEEQIPDRPGYSRYRRHGVPSEPHLWRERLHKYFDLGTVYTMIAGLLNVLAIYDAWGGPMIIVPAAGKPEEEDDDSGKHKRPS
ncbi:MAG: hypothetical protein KDA42_03665 [Planctomycetales bacterium]|nr:hypothetical protein [Planctomycetales bacterium]